MGDSRRSARSHKAIDYSKFGRDQDFADDDDDFAGLTPPPSKKTRTAKESKPKEKLKKKEKPKTDKKDVTYSGSKLSREEKTYERELQLALEMSKQNSNDAATPGEEEDNTEEDEKTVESDQKEETGKEADSEDAEDDADDIPEKKSTPTDKKARVVSPAVTSEDLDQIEVLEEDVQEESHGRRKRRAATKKKKYTDAFDDSDENEDGDEDFKVEKNADTPNEADLVDDDDDDDDNDDLDEDEDDDFSPMLSKKKKLKGKGRGKVKVIPPNKGAGKGYLKTSASSISLPKMDNSLPPLTKSSSTGALVIRKPNWCPPGPAGSTIKSPLGGVGIKSPGSLRLGLSKKARTKPLHPIAKS